MARGITQVTEKYMIVFASADRPCVMLDRLKTVTGLRSQDFADARKVEMRASDIAAVVSTGPKQRQPSFSRRVLVGVEISDADVPAYPLIGVDARRNEWAEWGEKAGVSRNFSVYTTFDVTLNDWAAARTGSGIALGDVAFYRMT